MMPSLFRKKSLDSLLADHNAGMSDGHGSGMKKILGVRDLTMMGVAAVIGAGIFSTIGSAAFNGGPGVIFLFLITAVTCGFTALCYAEFASRVPVSGSAYTYSYVTFGEIVAWILGWALILEYSIGNIVVAISWSAYFNNILHNVLGVDLPEWLTTGYATAKNQYAEAVAGGLPVAETLYEKAPKWMGIPFIINLPAFVVVLLITCLAYVGMQESKRMANAMVGLKLFVLLLVALVGCWFIFSEGTTANWVPFLPNGMNGVLKGVSAVFFAYIGFDAISTTAEECRNPQRDMPRGMIYSLILCTAIYVITTLVITGMVNYKEFQGVADPLAFVFDKVNMAKFGTFVSISAVVAATSVLLVFQIGQPRIWMTMSRDGLLPKAFSRIHTKYKTPWFATLITGCLVGIPVLFADDKLMTDLTSIGTLFAFALVCGGVLLLPAVKKEPGKFSLPFISGKWMVPVITVIMIFAFRQRLKDALLHISDEGYQEILFLFFIVASLILAFFSFRKNFSLIPVLGMLCCMYLMIEIPARSWLVFFMWMGVGLAFYRLYGFRKSRLKTQLSH